MTEIRMNLHESFFAEKEKTLLESGCFRVSAFRFPGGVCGLRVCNSRGEVVTLPYQGQQIWSARFDGLDLAMKSVFSEPVATRDYLGTYGGFLLHCGATAMGVPSADDSHPLHGELPNIGYEQAYAAMGEDEEGRYLAVGGITHYTMAFGTHYRAQPEVRLYENDTLVHIAMTLTNLRTRPMEYMYLCHINFHPVDGSVILDSTPADRDHVKVFRDIPPEMAREEREALAAYMDRVAADPSVHQVIDPASQLYDPEMVLAIHYGTDAGGWAHSMQLMPGGDAFYTAFRPEELPLGVRWIARNGDEDALGLVLPATGEHKGYAQAKKRGQVRILDGGCGVTLHMKTGYLDQEAAPRYQAKIRGILENL